MRSITTEQRVPVAVSMPGRYKSCRRSPSELFTKEQEEELQKCAQSEEYKNTEQDEAKEKESPVKSIEANPPKLTPLRWRSTSMKELNGSIDMAGSPLPTEESMKVIPTSSAQPAEEMRRSLSGPQSGQRPSMAQLRAQVMNSLSKEQGNGDVQQVERGDRGQSGELVDTSVGREKANGTEGSLHSAKPLGPTNPTARTELFPERPAANHEAKTVSAVAPEEPVKAPQRTGSFSLGGQSNGVANKPEKGVDLPEELLFQPVDLDKKYREKELVRHVTAAKIQIREEALLNNPGSPLNGVRKGPVGEEPSTMTIEFLRSRLQAERSTSKATKVKLENLSKKVSELENKLEEEVELRKKAEAALQDALAELAKLKLALPQADQASQQGAPIPAKPVADAESRDSTKTVQRVDAAGTEDSKENGSTTVNKDVAKGGFWKDRSVTSESLQNGGKENATKVSQESSSEASPERALSPNTPKQGKRAVIEERLRSMWAKIGQDMAALAEVRGDKVPAVNWMGQLPDLFEKHQSSSDSAAGSGQQADSSEGDSEQAKPINSKIKKETVSTKAAAFADKKSNSFKRNASLAKNVAKLVEQYEFQETAQKEWEENHQSLEQNEVEPPALVTPDGDVVTESTVRCSSKGTITRSQSEGKKNQNVNGEWISRSKSTGVLPSQPGMTSGSISRKGSMNGRIEILDDSPIQECGVEEELVFDPEIEVAEELPNGIYLHHSREEVDSSYKRGVAAKDAAVYRRGTERLGPSNERLRSESAHHSRERYPRADSRGPVREVQDRASRDMYYDPVIINSRGVRTDAPYSSEFHPRSRPVSGEMYRSGPWQEGHGMDRVPRQEERRGPPSLYSHSSGEEAPGLPYGYSKDHPEQDVPYRAGPYSNWHRGIPPAWQEGGDPSLRNRGMNPPPYKYPYGMEEPQHLPYGQPGMYPDPSVYGNRREMQYKSHGGAHGLKPEHYLARGMPGQRPPMNGYVSSNLPPGTQAFASPGGWESGEQEDSSAPVGGMAENAVPVPAGEAGEVLKALRIAKQQIKSSTGEQGGAFMTAQYTVSQEHRYGAGGQVSKTSYTVEAPMGYPFTKAVHEGWHLEGGKSLTKKRTGLNGSNGVATVDLTGANVTELISGACPLTVTGEESSYVEKLNVGRGIQFFFSG